MALVNLLIQIPLLRLQPPNSLGEFVIFEEYSCLWICNVDDAKVIDRICTCSKLIFQPESNKHCTKTKNKKHTTKDGKSKQTESCRDDEITKTNERKLKICEITYSIKIEGKTTWRDDFWIKIDPKSPP
ncbi:hypothetical protein MTR_4g018830 [Medicago truncatula]|uniref:Uncharacterized protein n=1 Tax=Medicago truncatula TaxID=3880 RepID=G7JR76_MEDTR|nr:hypothetical protein MTR_4g018830 [Medicago truncatula]